MSKILRLELRVVLRISSLNEMLSFLTLLGRGCAVVSFVFSKNCLHQMDVQSQ